MTKCHERSDAILAEMSTDFWVTTQHLVDQGAAPNTDIANGTLYQLERKRLVERQDINASYGGVKLPVKPWQGKIQVWRKIQ